MARVEGAQDGQQPPDVGGVLLIDARVQAPGAAAAEQLRHNHALLGERGAVYQADFGRQGAPGLALRHRLEPTQSHQAALDAREEVVAAHDDLVPVLLGELAGGGRGLCLSDLIHAGS